MAEKEIASYNTTQTMSQWSRYRKVIVYTQRFCVTKVYVY